MTGHHKAYPKYKDSDVEWLGHVPFEWNILRLKHLCSISTGDRDNIHKSNDGEFPFFVRSKNIERINSYSFDGEAVLTAGDGDIGKIFHYVNGKFDFHQRVYKFSDFKNVNGRYFYHYISCHLADEVVKLSAKTTVDSLRLPMLQNFVFCVPPLIEQAKIINFVDHETAKIDTLIEKQQQLIQLLKEKRQAVISHAVTKGLNPNAPMKDSGMEWLGEVPEHWELVPLKYLCNFSGGGTPSKDNLSYWTGGEIPWVSPKDMKSYWLSETQDKLTEKAVKESSTNYVDEGCLLMVVRSGILQRTIPIAINTVRVTLNQDMKALSFNSRMVVEYAANYILGNVNSLLLEWLKDGATVESIEHEYLANSLFPVPPVKEQIKINQDIKERMATFQNLEDRATVGIKLLQERRTAIISAAVTGKIDVRNWQAHSHTE